MTNRIFSSLVRVYLVQTKYIGTDSWGINVMASLRQATMACQCYRTISYIVMDGQNCKPRVDGKREEFGAVLRTHSVDLCRKSLDEISDAWPRNHHLRGWRDPKRDIRSRNRGFQSVKKEECHWLSLVRDVLLGILGYCQPGIQKLFHARWNER